MLLAHWGELHTKRGNVPLDVTPLLETVDDLENGSDILNSVLSTGLYRKHLAKRNNNQTVMIGDTTFDVLMAVNAGTAAIGVSWGVHEPHELDAAGAHRVIEEFHELPPILETLISG